MVLRSEFRASRRFLRPGSIVLLLLTLLAPVTGAQDGDSRPERAGEIRAKGPDPAATSGGSPQGDPAAGQEEALAVPPAARSEGDRLSPLDRAIALVLDSERTELARLQSAYDAASDAETALAVQRAIDALKQRSELQILEIQLTHFRAGGHAAAVAELEPVVEQMRAALADLPGVEVDLVPASGTEE